LLLVSAYNFGLTIRNVAFFFFVFVIIYCSVKVGVTGFEPYIVSHIIIVLSQVVLVVHLTDIFQRAQALIEKQNEAKKITFATVIEEEEQGEEGYNDDNYDDEEAGDTATLLNNNNNSNNTNNEITTTSNQVADQQQVDGVDAVATKKPSSAVNSPSKSSTQSPRRHKHKSKTIKKYEISEGLDWHTVAKVYLHPVVRVAFEIVILIQLCVTIVNYSIAGPTSLAQLFGRKDLFFYTIAPFVFILAVFIIVTSECIRHIISVATMVKAGLLLLLIVIGGIIGTQINRISVPHWDQFLQPVLVAGVTMGGILNVYPVIYSKVRPTRRNILILLFSVIAGIIVCGIIVLVWTYFVLKIVPQTSAVPTEPSLAKSLQYGEIATVPMIEVIQKYNVSMNWMGMLAQLFIITSITVSFVTYGTALKHMRMLFFFCFCFVVN